MCLISIAPKGTKKQTKEVENFIKEGLSSNTHGSGIMFKRHNTNLVNIKKGLKTFDDIMEAIEEAKLVEDDELVIHHRIGTSGEQSSLNTHPFLVSQDIGVMESIVGEFNLPAMAHNGIFSEYSDHLSKYNDTFHFVNKFIATPQILSLLEEDPKLLEDFCKSKIGGAKLAFLFPNRDLVMIGNFVKDNGYYHSNNGYKTYTYDKGGSSDNNHGNNSRIGRSWNYPLTEDEKAWENFYNEGYDQYTPPNKRIEEKPVKLTSKLLKNTETTQFAYGDIEITKDNFKDFMFLLTKELKGYQLLDAKKAYHFDDLGQDDSKFSYVYAYPNGNQLIMVNTEEFLENCIFQVKHEKTIKYKALNSLIKHTKREISKSMAKKIQNCLNKNWNKTEFKFKEYGVFPKNQLNYFFKNYGDKKLGTNQKLETTVISKTNKDVTTNADMV